MRRKPMLAFLCMLVLAFSALTWRTAQATRYYVWDGSTLQPLLNTQGIAVDHWAIWVFGDGVAAVPGRQWGEIDGKTAAQAEARWEREVRFEKVWKKCAHITSDPVGCENHLGPIAVIKPTRQVGNARAARASTETNDLCDRLIKDFGFANRLVTAYNKYIKQPYHPLYQSGRTELQEYLENLRKQMERVNELRHRLNDIDSTSLADVQRQLHLMNHSLALAASQGQTLAKSLHVSGNDRGDTSWSGRTMRGFDGDDYTLTLAGDGFDLKKVAGGGASQTVWTGHISFSNVAGVARGGKVVSIVVKHSITEYLNGVAHTTDPETLIFDTLGAAKSFCDYVRAAVKRKPEARSVGDDTSWSGKTFTAGSTRYTVTLAGDGLDDLVRSDGGTLSFHIPLSAISHVSAPGQYNNVVVNLRKDILCRYTPKSGGSYSERENAVTLWFRTRRDAEHFIQYVKHQRKRSP